MINTSGTNGDSDKGGKTLPISVVEKIAEWKNMRARRNRRGRLDLRTARRKTRRDRKRARRGDITVAPDNVETIVADGKHWVKQIAEARGEYRQAELDEVALK